MQLTSTTDYAIRIISYLLKKTEVLQLMNYRMNLIYQIVIIPKIIKNLKIII